MSILRLKIEIPFAFYYSVFDKKITDCPKESLRLDRLEKTRKA